MVGDKAGALVYTSLGLAGFTPNLREASRSTAEIHVEDNSLLLEVTVEIAVVVLQVNSRAGPR